MIRWRIANICLALIAWVLCVIQATDARGGWGWWFWMILSWLTGGTIGPQIAKIWLEYKEVKRVMEERGAVYWEE